MHCPRTPQLVGTLPALNGVRGVAVLLVFLFHANVPGFTGAFIGVDIFFVLSGFLITALLLQEYQRHGRISLKKFYLRRVLRLLPALLLLLVVYLLYCFTIYPDAATRMYHLQDAGMALFYAANWTRAFGLDRPFYLGHCWSLSIEEQFYALWPILLLLLLRIQLQKRLALVIGLFLASWGWRVWLLAQGADWARVYNGFDTRADMLLAGCSLAMLFNAGMLERWRNLLATPFATWSAVFLLGVLAVIARWQTNVLYQWQYLLVALATLVMLVGLLTKKSSALSRLLCFAPLVGLGTISYAVYLWHYPLLHFMIKQGYTGAALVIWTAILTVAMSVVSWYAVELPALRLKHRFSVGGSELSEVKTGSNQ